MAPRKAGDLGTSPQTRVLRLGCHSSTRGKCWGRNTCSPEKTQHLLFKTPHSQPGSIYTDSSDGADTRVLERGTPFNGGSGGGRSTETGRRSVVAGGGWRVGTDDGGGVGLLRGCRVSFMVKMFGT